MKNYPIVSSEENPEAIVNEKQWRKSQYEKKKSHNKGNRHAKFDDDEGEIFPNKRQRNKY